jgi:5,10-methylenetetrahydromethanopterin reductase
MSTHRVSIAFQTDKPLAAYGSLAATVEQYGFDGVTVYNDMLYQPAWLPLLEIARATRRIRIGPAAVNPFTCHPITIAGMIAQIDEAAQGRAYLGLARGGWLEYAGLHPAHGVTALREAFESIRHLLQRKLEPYPGTIFSLAGDALRWAAIRPDIPFLLGTWGVKTIQACAHLVDEVKIGGTANPDLIPYYVEKLAQAAAARGAQAPPRIVAGAVSVVDLDGAAARVVARREVALYLPVVAELDPTLTLDPDLVTALRAATAHYDFDQAARLISDDLLRKFAFAGTPDEVAAQAHSHFAAGAGRVEFGTPHGLSAQEGLRLLGTHVLPALGLDRRA